MRTEKEILKDFEKLGCKVRKPHKKIFIDSEFNKNYRLDIEIDTEMLFIYVTSAGIDGVFIPLLNELMECLKKKKLKRSEEQVLNDFKDLGYIIEKNNDELLQLNIPSDGCTILFTKADKLCNKFPSEGSSRKRCSLSTKEIELIKELFKVWGWVNDNSKSKRN